MMLPRALALTGALILAAHAGAAPAANNTAHDQLVKAVELARTGHLDEALAIVDPVLKAHPTASKVRLLRAKMRIKKQAWEAAEEDLEQLRQETPDNADIKKLLASVRTHIAPRSVTVVGGAASYSEWVWSWKIPGNKAFTLADFKGAQGHTLFYWPARPGDAAEIQGYETDSGDQLYFFRQVDVKGADGKPDLKLPGGEPLGVKAVPYAILIDAAGTEVARGAPAEVQAKLDAIKQAAKQAKAPAVETVVKQDFSTDTNLEALARPGFTTVVMLTSDG